MFPSHQIVLGALPLPCLCPWRLSRPPQTSRGSRQDEISTKTSPRQPAPSARALPFVHEATLAKRLQPLHSMSLSHFLFPLCFQRAAASSALSKASSSLFSMRCRLLRENECFFPCQNTPLALAPQISPEIGYLFSFHTVPHSLALRKTISLFFSESSELFAQKHRGWGYILQAKSF